MSRVSESSTWYGIPSTHVVMISESFCLKISPSDTNKLAILPLERLPTLSSTPNNLAGLRVKDFNAALGSNPLSTALLRCLKKFAFGESIFEEEIEKGMPCFFKKAGLDGANSQC